jgi:hypothetical protein
MIEMPLWMQDPEIARLAREASVKILSASIRYQMRSASLEMTDIGSVFEAVEIAREYAEGLETAVTELKPAVEAWVERSSESKADEIIGENMDADLDAFLKELNGEGES